LRRRKIEEKHACKQCHELKLRRAGSVLSHEWEKQPTSSGSFFFRHKVTGETRWGLSGHQIECANLSHEAAMQRMGRMDDPFKMEQTDVEGRVLQQLADRRKHEVAAFEPPQSAGAVVHVHFLNGATDDFAAQVLELPNVMMEYKEFALRNADKELFLAEERLKVIVEEEALLAGLQEEKKKNIAALQAQQQQVLEDHKKRLMAIQSVEERSFFIWQHEAKAQVITEDIKAERQLQERAASERLQKMKQRKSELRIQRVIREFYTHAAGVSQLIVLSNQDAYNWAQNRHPTAHTFFLDIRDEKAFAECRIATAVRADIELMSRDSILGFEYLDPSAIELSFTDAVAQGQWRNRGASRIAVVGSVAFSMLKPDSSEVAFLYYLMRCCHGSQIAYLENSMPEFCNAYPFMCEVPAAESHACSSVIEDVMGNIRVYVCVFVLVGACVIVRGCVRVCGFVCVCGYVFDCL